jgi:ADP-heptose:LPS heptosyltransferase
MIGRPSWLVAGTDYYVLFAGAAAAIKRWPSAHFAAIASRLHARTGWTGIVCGLAADSPAAQIIVERAIHCPIIDACGRTTLPELAGIIARAKLTVTNDTSAAHLAAVLGVPAVAVVGGGHFGRFFPYPVECMPADGNLRTVHHPMPCFQCNWHCIYAPGPSEAAPCVSSVSVEDMWAAIESLLIRSLGSDRPHAVTGNPAAAPSGKSLS